MCRTCVDRISGEVPPVRGEPLQQLDGRDSALGRRLDRLRSDEAGSLLTTRDEVDGLPPQMRRPGEPILCSRTVRLYAQPRQKGVHAFRGYGGPYYGATVIARSSVITQDCGGP